MCSIGSLDSRVSVPGGHFRTICKTVDISIHATIVIQYLAKLMISLMPRDSAGQPHSQGVETIRTGVDDGLAIEKELEVNGDRRRLRVDIIEAPRTDNLDTYSHILLTCINMNLSGNLGYGGRRQC